MRTRSISMALSSVTRTLAQRPLAVECLMNGLLFIMKTVNLPMETSVWLLIANSVACSSTGRMPLGPMARRACGPDRSRARMSVTRAWPFRVPVTTGMGRVAISSCWPTGSSISRLRTCLGRNIASTASCLRPMFSKVWRTSRVTHDSFEMAMISSKIRGSWSSMSTSSRPASSKKEMPSLILPMKLLILDSSTIHDEGYCATGAQGLNKPPLGFDLFLGWVFNTALLQDCADVKVGEVQALAFGAFAIAPLILVAPCFVAAIPGGAAAGSFPVALSDFSAFFWIVFIICPAPLAAAIAAKVEFYLAGVEIRQRFHRQTYPAILGDSVGGKFCRGGGHANNSIWDW